MNRIIKHVLLIISASFLITQTALGENKNMDNVTVQDTLNAVISNGNNGFIAVGEKGTIVENKTGTTNWIRYSSHTENDLHGIIKTKKGFVIVGDKGTILTGTHGDKWESQVSNTTSDLHGIAYTNGKYVVVGDNGVILSSPNGTVWKEQKSSIDTALYAITYSDTLKKWVAAGSYSTILVSDDAVSWIKYGTPNSNLSTVIWSPVSKEFVAVGYRLRPLGTVATTIEGVVLSSQDGISWHVTHESGAITQIRGITYSDKTGEIVAVGERGTIITSPNGKDWKYHKTGNNDDLYGITYANGYFTAVGRFGAAYISGDGAEWENMSLGIPKLPANTNNISVTVDREGNILTSPDNITWTKSKSKTDKRLWGVAHSGGTYVAVGEKGAILTSRDGKDWTNWLPVVSYNLSGIAWSGKRFVIAGEGGILTSTTGEEWTARDNIGAGALSGVIWTGTQFVAIGYLGDILTSTDGIKWIKHKSGTTESLNKILWSEKKKLFVVVGSHGTVLTSPDGAKWTKQDTKVKASLRGIAYSPVSDKYVAFGSGYLLASTDTLSWKTVMEGVAEMKEGKIYNTGDWFDDINWSVEFESGQFVATTEDGAIYKSVDGIVWQNIQTQSSYSEASLKANNIEQVILLDVHGLFGGTDLWIAGDGQAVARFVGPRADGPGGLWQLCYSFKLSGEQQEKLLALIREQDFYHISIPFRLGVIDEARPAIYIKGEKTYAVAKWEMDMHPQFDTIYFFLKDVAQSGKKGTKLEYSPYKWNWKPEGFTPSQEIRDMTSPVKPQN